MNLYLVQETGSYGWDVQVDKLDIPEGQFTVKAYALDSEAESDTTIAVPCNALFQIVALLGHERKVRAVVLIRDIFPDMPLMARKLFVEELMRKYPKYG